MKLPEKIVTCRKKAGLSQEALADRIGVSRQAISKWETGDAAPEISKLLVLAQVFGVTTDWLLSEDEPEPQAPLADPPQDASGAAAQAAGTWVEAVPGVLGKLIRRYGWLCGVYIAVTGLGMTIIGGLARGLTRRMFSGFGLDGFGVDSTWFDNAGNVIESPFGEQVSFVSNNPVSIMGGVILMIGIVMMIGGTILAIYLKKRGDAAKK